MQKIKLLILVTIVPEMLLALDAQKIARAFKNNDVSSYYQNAECEDVTAQFRQMVNQTTAPHVQVFKLTPDAGKTTHALILCDDTREPRGSITYKPAKHTGDMQIIKRLHIHAEQRGHGYGGSLLSYILQQCKTTNCFFTMLTARAFDMPRGTSQAMAQHN